MNIYILIVLKKTTCFLLLFFIHYHSYAQIKQNETIPFENFGESKINKKILRFDQQGFLWYNVLNGFVRYSGDASHFFEFNHPSKKELHTDYFQDFLITEKDLLIAATTDGILFFDLNTGERKLNIFKNEDGTIPSFNSIKKDPEKDLFWLGSTSSKFVYSFSLETNTIKKYNVSHGNYKVKFVKNSCLILINNEGVFKAKIDKNSNTLDDQILYHYRNTNTKAVIVENSTIMPKDEAGFYLYNNRKYTFITLKDIDCQIIEIPFDNVFKYKENINANTFEQSVLMQDHTTIKEYVLKISNSKKVLKLEKNGIHVNKVLTDHFSTYDCVEYDNYNLWIPTESGLVKLPIAKSPFKSFLKNEVNSISCRSITEIDNQIIVSTYSGFFKKKQDENEFKKLNLIGEKDLNLKLDFLKLTYGFHKLNDSILLTYGFYDRKLFKINLKTNNIKVINFNLETSYTQGLSFWDIVPYRQQELFVASNNGLYRFTVNPAENSLVYDLIEENQLNDTINLQNHKLTALHFDKQHNNLWIGSDRKGLYKKNLDTGSVMFYSKKNRTLSNNIITDIYQDTNYNVWVGTENGLHKFNWSGKLIKVYNQLNGLQNTVVTKIQESDNAIWIGTYKGLAALNKSTDEIHFFYSEDGISNDEFNKKSAYITKDGKAYFGGIDGLTFFNPKNIILNKENYTLHLLELTKYDIQKKASTTKRFDLDKLKAITLPHDKNYISLEFGIANLEVSKNVTYQYQFDDNPWILLDNNILSLQGLAAGEHHIKVKGIPKTGIKTNVLNYTLIIDEVFYKKKWFQLLIIFVICLVVYYFYKIKQKQFAKLHQKKLIELDLKLKLSLNLMSPHFIFNILTGLQTTTLIDDVLEANKNFDRYSEILRQTIDLCNKENIILQEEIAYIKKYIELENNLLESDIELIIDVDSKISLDTLSIPTMMLQPIVENAIRHGLVEKCRNKQLHICFQLAEEFLVITVEDNGIGRHVNNDVKGRKSWATSIINNRMEIYSQLGKEMILKIHDLKDVEGKSVGTKVELKIFTPSSC
ncbi:MAG: histidine kinase [Kordia sp.]|uniref:histidine kinase n=1 Tax=Kordia sp. TaxID=1965332 RepID=UPI00385B981D